MADIPINEWKGDLHWNYIINHLTGNLYILYVQDPTTFILNCVSKTVLCTTAVADNKVGIWKLWRYMKHICSDISDKWSELNPVIHEHSNDQITVPFLNFDMQSYKKKGTTTKCYEGKINCSEKRCKCQICY